MTNLPIIAVDANGRDAKGDDFNDAASPDVVAAGLLEMRLVVLQYPDGRRRVAEQIMVTEKGRAELRRQMAADGAPER